MFAALAVSGAEAVGDAAAALLPRDAAVGVVVAGGSVASTGAADASPPPVTAGVVTLGAVASILAVGRDGCVESHVTSTPALTATRAATTAHAVRNTTGFIPLPRRSLQRPSSWLRPSSSSSGPLAWPWASVAVRHRAQPRARPHVETRPRERAPWPPRRRLRRHQDTSAGAPRSLPARLTHVRERPRPWPARRRGRC